MQIDYANDGHGLPSDFPSDPAFPWDMVLGVLGLFLLVAVLIALFWLFQRLGRQMVIRESDDAIAKKVDLISKALSRAARAPRDQQEDKLRAAIEEIDKHFGKTLGAAEKISKAAGGVNTGLEGLLKKDAPANAMFPSGSHVHGNTIINIAVNAGEVSQGPSGAAPAPAPAPAATEDEITPRERREIVWEAVQRIFDYWKYRASVAASLRAVRQQLDESPPWASPRFDGNLIAAMSRREESL